jgi:sulfur-oxidizing protein SoxY
MSHPGMKAQALVGRRRLLQGAAAMVSVGVVALRPAQAALPDPLAAFTAETFGDAVAALVGATGSVLVPSALVTLDVPVVADNGAFVPVTVASALPGTREILLLVDGNPQPVAARFLIPPGTEPFVATRIRMAASGTVHAAVRTEEGVFAAMRSVQVAVGGCA